MAVGLPATFQMAGMVWHVLKHWILRCIAAAIEIAHAFHVGDIGPFHVG